MVRIRSFLKDGTQHFITTPNPEILLKAYLPKHKDGDLFNILNASDIAVADGFGIKLAGWASGYNIPRITGADLVKKILQIARQENFRVAVIAPCDGLSSRDDIANAFNKHFPGLKYKIFFLEKGANIKRYTNEHLRQFQPDILLATLGAPQQEKFIYYNLSLYPSVKLGVGVGGALDFITGRSRRAPLLLRRLGLEWMWRLFWQPLRIKRIINAVVVFPYQFLKWKFFQPFTYRSNVACLLYKKEGDKYKILVVERKGQKGHWQIPQGGIEKESLEQAGSRELQEELGTDKFIPRADYKLNFKYQFPIKRHQSGGGGYKGQKQGLLLAEFLGRDNDIKLNAWDHSSWKWVDADSLLKVVHPSREVSTGIFLKKFHDYISQRRTQ